MESKKSMFQEKISPYLEPVADNTRVRRIVIFTKEDNVGAYLQLPLLRDNMGNHYILDNNSVIVEFITQFRLKPLLKVFESETDTTI